MKYNDLFKLLKNDGWVEIRQKGSHITMKHPIKPDQITVPFHAGKEVKKRIVEGIIETGWD